MCLKRCGEKSVDLFQINVLFSSFNNENKYKARIHQLQKLRKDIIMLNYGKYRSLTHSKIHFSLCWTKL